MKKALVTLLCTFIVLCSVLPCGAACAHSYVETHHDATCVSRAFTDYTCESCGDSYHVYESLYTAPESCYMALEGDRKDDTLTVTVSLYNNPGFWANRLTLRFNGSALEVISAENGNVWEKSASITVESAPSPSYVRFYCESSELGNNTNNGVVFKVTFKINDTVDNWGIKLEARSMDNINHTHQPVSLQLISTVSLGYGEHSYEYSGVVEEPTYDSEGIASYCCTYCSETKTEAIPSLERPPVGDVNGDGTLDMRDSLDLKLRIADSTKDNEYDPVMDVNEDGRINAKDLLIIKKLIAGVYN